MVRLQSQPISSVVSWHSRSRMPGLSSDEMSPCPTRTSALATSDSSATRRCDAATPPPRPPPPPPPPPPPLRRRQRLLRARSDDGDARDVRGGLEQPPLAGARPARLAIVHREGPEAFLSGSQDGRRPTRLQAVF